MLSKPHQVIQDNFDLEIILYRIYDVLNTFYTIFIKYGICLVNTWIYNNIKKFKIVFGVDMWQ